MKNLITPLLLLAGLAAMSSCKKDEPAPSSNEMTLSGEMTGAKAVPATTSTGTGTVTGTYNKDTNVLTYSVAYSGLSGPATMAHFHLGAPGVAGDVVVSFANVTTSPITGTATLDTQAKEDALLAGNFYANIHTAANKLGEIRGNVAVK